MKAISLWQPWASAMQMGLKRVETRHWATRYRGPMAIHAAKRWTAEEREFVEDMVERGHFPSNARPMPFGAIVAVGRLANIFRSEDLEARLDERERAWGNYGPRRYGWMFEEIRPLEQPIPFKGAQGLFDIPEHVLGPGYRPPTPPAAAEPVLLTPAQGSLL